MRTRSAVRWLLLLGCLFGLCLGPGARGQADGRAAAPSAPSAPAAQAPPAPRPAPAAPRLAVPHEYFGLKNGLRVILQEDHRAPFVTVCVVYRVGAYHEAAGQSGLAHFFEHLMFEGSQGTLPRNAGQMLNEMGAVKMNGTTGWDQTVYYETIPAVNLRSALWLESDRMASLTTVDSGIKLDEVRGIVKNERRQRLETVAYGSAREALMPVLFPPPHPYARTVVGSMEDLDRATPKDMRSFYQSYYGPNNATLVVVGDFEPAAARQLVNKYFAPLPSRPVPAELTWPAPAPAKETKLRVVDRVASRPALLMAWPSPKLFGPDEGVAEVTAQILSVRLQRRLVRLLNLATEVEVEQEGRAAQSLFEVLVILRGQGPIAKVQAMVDAVLEELRQDLASEEEVERARLTLSTQLLWSLEDPIDRARLLARYLRFHSTADWFHEDLARYQRVRAADIGRFVREVLRPEARVLVEVEPTAKGGR